MLPQGPGCKEFEKAHRRMHQEMKRATRKSDSDILLNLLLTCVCTEPEARKAERDILAAAKYRKNNAAKVKFGAGSMEGSQHGPRGSRGLRKAIRRRLGGQTCEYLKYMGKRRDQRS
jgi:hypothetical protein